LFTLQLKAMAGVVARKAAQAGAKDAPIPLDNIASGE
jgi:hypothetical protein